MIYFKDENGIVHSLGSYSNFPTGEPLTVSELPEPSEQTYSENYKFYKLAEENKVYITEKTETGYSWKQII